MLNNLMYQTPEDQFLHWLQEIERKQEEELQAGVERLQYENDQLWAQVEESRDLGKDV